MLAALLVSVAESVASGTGPAEDMQNREDMQEPGGYAEPGLRAGSLRPFRDRSRAWCSMALCGNRAMVCGPSAAAAGADRAGPGRSGACAGEVAPRMPPRACQRTGNPDRVTRPRRDSLPADGLSSLCGQVDQSGRTCSACGPFWPWPAVNSTRWFS